MPSQSSFLFAFRQILFVTRAIGLAPCVIREDHNGKSYITTSTSVQVYSYLVATVAYASVILLVNVQLSNDGYYIADSKWVYVNIRIAITTLIPVCCWRNLPLTLSAFAKVGSLGMKVPVTKRWIGFPLLYSLFPLADGILWKFMDSERSFFHVIRGFFVEVVPLLMSTFLCTQFVFQVNVLNIAVSELNCHVSMVLKEQKAGLTKSALRPIMRLQHTLWKTYSTLNAAYGFPLLFVIAAGFLEASAAVIVFTEFRPFKEIVLALVWAILSNLPMAKVMHICQETEDKFLACKSMYHELKITPRLSLTEFTELFEWEVQLRHETIEYNSCGLFGLNGRHLNSMICSIISYYFCVNWLFESKLCPSYDE